MIRNLHEELGIPVESLIMANQKTVSHASRRSVSRNQGTKIRIHCKDGRIGPIAVSGSHGKDPVPAQGLKRRHKR